MIFCDEDLETSDQFMLFLTHHQGDQTSDHMQKNMIMKQLYESMWIEKDTAEER